MTKPDSKPICRKNVYSKSLLLQVLTIVMLAACSLSSSDVHAQKLVGAPVDTGFHHTNSDAKIIPPHIALQQVARAFIIATLADRSVDVTVLALSVTVLSNRFFAGKCSLLLVFGVLCGLIVIERSFIFELYAGVYIHAHDALLDWSSSVGLIMILWSLSCGIKRRWCPTKNFQKPLNWSHKMCRGIGSRFRRSDR